MTDEQWSEMLIPGITAFKLQDKLEVEMPIRTSDLFETDYEALWSDEDLLRVKDPDGYRLNVDGERVIHVKLEDGQHVIYKIIPQPTGTVIPKVKRMRVKYDRGLI